MGDVWDLVTIDERHALKGHSGARVDLLVRGSERRVRKTAAAEGSNARLAAQMARQQSAHAAGLRTPRVQADGLDHGRFFFEMEYIPGRSVARSFLEGRPADLDALAGFLVNTINAYRATERGLLPEAIFADKMSSIGQTCAPRLRSLGRLAEFETLAAFVLNGTLAIPCSDGHGDLSFENIIIDASGQFVLIDFDDPGFSSWMLDFAKVLQDVCGRWCLRTLILGAPRPQPAITMNALLEMERAKIRVKGALDRQLRVPARTSARLCVFQLLRILPYCLDSEMAAYVLTNAMAVQSEA